MPKEHAPSQYPFVGSSDKVVNGRWIASGLWSDNSNFAECFQRIPQLASKPLRPVAVTAN
ncbi:MAG: hypothetical protein JWN11_2842 [Hyphomicrobiales bacterium]|nr:hypothetical protein [Hyphomicrobiales bacterium]